MLKPKIVSTKKLLIQQIYRFSLFLVFSSPSLYNPYLILNAVD